MTRNLLLFVLCLFLLAAGQGANAQEHQQQVLDWLNRERCEAGMQDLEIDERLSDIAMKQALEMVELGYFSHISPRTGTPANRVRNAGLQFQKLGENAARHSKLSVIHDALMRSPSHKGNILDADFRKIGVGIVRQPDGRFLVVQVFLRELEEDTTLVWEE